MGTELPRVLVTGAAGFLGRSICGALSSQADLATTDLADPPTLLPNFQPARLGTPEDALPLMDGIDCVVHAAGIAHVFQVDDAAAHRMEQANGHAAGATAAAAAAAGVKRFLLISSISVYGNPGIPMVNEDHPCRPSSPYARSKLLGEQLVAEALAGSGTACTIVRPATIYGEEDRGNVRRLIQTVHRGRFIWIGKGENSKSLIHREDVAHAIAAAAVSGSQTAGTYNLAAAPVRMHAIVSAIASALDRGVPSWHIPAGPARLAARCCASAGGPLGGIGESVLKWLSDDSYDGSRFEKTFGFQPQVPLSQGIRQEVDWYLANHGGD